MTFVDFLCKFATAQFLQPADEHTRTHKQSTGHKKEKKRKKKEKKKKIRKKKKKRKEKERKEKKKRTFHSIDYFLFDM